jgi:hypothetical protein
MANQRLPEVNGDDGAWGTLLNTYLNKEHYNNDNSGVGTSDSGGHMNITVRGGTTAAGTAPIKLTSGPLMTGAEAGAIEFLTDDLLFTQTTGTTRKKVATFDTNTNASLTAGNVIEGYATTVTGSGGGTLTMVFGDKFQQYFTGSTTHIVLMPVAANCALGQQWQIINNSTGQDALGAITIQTSAGAGNTILVLAAGSYVTLTCIGATTGVASWSYSQDPSHMTVSKTQPTQAVYGDIWVDIS